MSPVVVSNLHKLHVLMRPDESGFIRLSVSLNDYAAKFALECLRCYFRLADEVISVQLQSAELCSISQRNRECPFCHLGLLLNSLIYRSVML